MDPAAKAYLDKLTATMEANTAALTAVTIRLDDLVAWRPDLERRVSDLGDPVTALQQVRANPTSDNNGVALPLRSVAPPPALPTDKSGLAEGDEDAPDDGTTSQNHLDPALVSG